MRILGIDPGTRLAGWGILSFQASGLSLIAFGALKTPPPWPLPRRLEMIFEGYERMLREYRPHFAALEETFAGNNPKAAIAMGEGRGVALLALARAQLEVVSLSPGAIKKAVTGDGQASKARVAQMVCARLALSTTPKPEDITDALAVAIALSQRLPVPK